MVRSITIDPKAAAKEREEALARLTWWTTQGLLETERNLEELQAYIKVNGNTLTETLVDNAVISLRDMGRLDWKGKPAPAADGPPAAPVAPPEPRRLDNGELELPLNADEWTMRKASKVQLLDLSARRKEGRQRPAGWVGSSF